MKPRVSVIVPVYNTEAFLPETLDCLLGQTLKELEVICIDDASPDSCGRILDEYASRDSRVRVFHLQENRMQGYGRNLGIENAEGEYLYFLDSDDLIEDSALEELCRKADEMNTDVIVFDYRNIYDTPELRKRFPDERFIRTGEYSSEPVSGSILLDDFHLQGDWTCLPQTYFWRTSMIREKNVRNPVGAEHEDEYFAFAGLLSAERALYLPKAFFIHRYRENSVMTRERNARDFHGYLKIYHAMNRFIAERDIHTFGSTTCISIMYYQLVHYYRLLDYHTLRDYCASDPQDLVMFECFASAMKAQGHLSRTAGRIEREVRGRTRIFIYGAGKVAEKFAGDLFWQGRIDPSGFLVSSREGNPETLLDLPVICIDDYTYEEGDLVIVAVSEKYLPDIRKALSSRRIPWIYYYERKTAKTKALDRYYRIRNRIVRRIKSL